eukprot:jgi/Mesvir1/10161/Mv18041-RA.1
MHMSALVAHLPAITASISRFPSIAERNRRPFSRKHSSFLSRPSLSRPLHPRSKSVNFTVMKRKHEPVLSQAGASAHASSQTHASNEGAVTRLQVHTLDDMSEAQVKNLLARPRIDFSSIFAIVGPIVDAVKSRGDDAVLELTEKFDKVRPEKLVERLEDIPMPKLDADVAAAFDVAMNNIRAFHVAQLPGAPLEVETMPGVKCRRVHRPIESVGLYIPGGTAVLPSTASMLAVPAAIAGCKNIVVATPPRRDGSIAPEVLYVAKKAGATHLLKAGGAQCDALPRSDIARKALAHSYVVKVSGKEQACRFSNMYAPEHLIVNVEDAEGWLAHLDNAGSIFLGRWTPESVGDYASGTNHVLPTYGYARMYGGVSLDSFMKYMTVQNLTYEGLQNLGPSVAKMAAVEGLDAHKRAVTLRLGMPS